MPITVTDTQKTALQALDTQMDIGFSSGVSGSSGYGLDGFTGWDGLTTEIHTTVKASYSVFFAAVLQALDPLLGGVVTNFEVPLVYKGETGITAHAGGGQGSATPLTAEVNFVTAVGSTGDSVRLPAPVLGARIVVFTNDPGIGDPSLAIFPASGHSIDGLGANNAYSLANNNSREFWGQSATAWRSR